MEARDLTEYKVDLIRENIERSGLENIYARRKDALFFGTLQIRMRRIWCWRMCPAPVTELIGHKTDIKYKMTPAKEAELVLLQRRILHNAAQCVQPEETLIITAHVRSTPVKMRKMSAGFWNIILLRRRA